MVPAPRFRRVAALQRGFVDREPVLEAFTAALDRLGTGPTGPTVFNITGVGGIGKSRLLRELADRASPRCRTATLDLHIPALRQPDDALAVLRGALGAQGVLPFDRFDIAYAVLWQRLHPHLRLNTAELPFVEGSSILTDIADTMAGLPFFGTARGLAKILERGTSDVRRRRRVRRDPTLQALDDLPNADLADAVTFLFAEELRAGSTDKPYVVVVDSYEALVPTPVRTGRAQLADAWLRDLVAQLDAGLVVVASREGLRWQAHDPAWAGIVDEVDLGGLPMPARLELLEAGGITDADGRQTIAEASAGLPFYLHLAVDTHQQAGGQPGGTLVAPHEILARFLLHVAAEEIRSLEVLSPARVFDYAIFRLLTAAYHLPGDRLAWESLTSYSFVYPAGAGLRFHQLMATALADRLPTDVTTEIHALLRGHWDGRAAQAPDGAASAHAAREAAHHGLHAGQLDGTTVLGYADHAVKRGGHSAADGITGDLAAWVADRPPGAAGELAEALRCLRAEAAVRRGDAEAVITLAPAPTDGGDTVRSEVGARLALAAGHGRRIAGDTRAALDIFTHVWHHATGAPRRQAGLWAADLHMAQGRFRDAVALATAAETLTPADCAEFRGDLARLRHLAHRFAFDADRYHLDEATGHYQGADSVLGLANLATNRAELLATTAPAAAVAAAGQAIDVHQETGAHHELGKAYTALAAAHLRTGHLDEADAALQSALAALERAGYRSGRARAEFHRAALCARRGRLDETRTALRWAVAELQAADVYPTLILCAARMLDLLGIPDDAITAAAHQARATVQPFGTFGDLDEGITAFVTSLLGHQTWQPVPLYRAALARTDAASGFYNHNIRMDTPTGDVIVRIPIPGSDTMDLAIWPEAGTLRAIRGTIAQAPRLLYAHDTPAFGVLEFLGGQLLDTLAPRGTPVPGHVLGDVADLFARLGHVGLDRLPPLPDGWPADGHTAAFAHRLSAITAAVHTRFLPEFGGLFADLGIPADPLAATEDRWDTLTPRPFRLLHTDIHRKNMIVDGGRTYFLDWELALWGDPVYDLAVHLHKTAYLPDEQAAVRAGWLAAVPAPASAGWEADLDTYLAHERVKSAIVDTVRYTKLITAGNLPAEREDALVGKLLGKLAAARAASPAWRSRTPPPDRAAVAARIQQWASTRQP